MDEEHTITLNLGSSPDPLIDPILSPPMLPPSRVKPRAQPAARLLSIARSPRKRTFELDIGSPVSPQRLLVTVQAEDEVKNTKGIKRRLFQSPTPKRGVMRGGGDVTTTVVPVRGLSDDEGVTPRRRGRPRKSGTPVPTTRRKRPGTPGAKAVVARGTSRSPQKSPQKQQPLDEDALEHIEATPRPVSLLKRPAKRKSMTPAKEDTQPRKRGRPRKSQVPAEMNMGSIAEILQQDNASRLPPVQHDFFGRDQFTAGEVHDDDGAGDMEDDIWLGTLSSPAAQRLRTSLSNRSPPKEPSPAPEPEPEAEPSPEPEQQPQPEHSEGDFDEQGEWGDMHDGPEDDYDEGDYMTSPVRDLGDAQDTMAGAEDFTEVPLAELRSLMNSSMMAGQEQQQEEELGEATKVIIKNGIDYLRQGRGTAAREGSQEAVQETGEKHDFGFSVGPGRTSQLEAAEPRKPFDFGSSFHPGQSTQMPSVRRRRETNFNFSVGPEKPAASSHAEQLEGLDFGQSIQKSPTPPRKNFDFDFSILPGENTAAERRSESASSSPVGQQEAKAAERAAVMRREVVGFGSSIGPVQKADTSSFEVKSRSFDPDFFSDESREQSAEPRQGSEEPRRYSEEPRRESEEPRQESEEPRHESEEPKQASEEPSQKEQYSRSRPDPDFEFSDGPVPQPEPDQDVQPERQWAETSGYSATEQQDDPGQEPDREQPKPYKRPYKRLPPRPSEVEIRAEVEAEDEPADDSDAWWNRVPEKPKPIKKPKSLLGKLIRKAARQRTDSANTTQEPSPADTSNLSGEGDSFSTLPDEVYAAATPGQHVEPQLEEQHDDEVRDGEREEEPDNDGGEEEAQAASHPIQPSIERPSPVNHSIPHLESNRLLTPDETPSPIPSEAEGDGVDEDAGNVSPNQPAQPNVQVEMPSSPPASDPSPPVPVARLPQHTRTKSNETPADQLSDVAPLPRTDLNVQSLNLAPPGSQPRPSLSPIVRAGRVLQLVTSDPPSPPGRDSVLRSPFRGSFEKSSQSPAPFISQPRATRSPSPQRTDTAQEKQQDRPWFRGLQQIKNFVAETAKSLSPTRISNPRPEPEQEPEEEPEEDLQETPSRRSSGREARFSEPEVDPEATVSAPNSAIAEPARRRAQERAEPARTSNFGFRGSFTSSRNHETTDRRPQQKATRLPAKKPTPQPEPEPFTMDPVNTQQPEQPAQEEEDDADFWLEAGGVTPFAPRVVPPQIKAPVVESRQSSKIPTLGRSISRQQQRDGQENQLRSSRNSQIDDAYEIEQESSSILEQLDKRPAVKPTPAPARTNLSGFFSSPVLLPGQETPGMGLFKPSRREPANNLVQQQQKERKKLRQPDNSLFAHLVEIEEQQNESVTAEAVTEKQPGFGNASQNVEVPSGAHDDSLESIDGGLKGKEKDRGRRSTSARAQEIMEKRLARITEGQRKAKEQMTAASTSQSFALQSIALQPSTSQPSASQPSAAQPSTTQPSTSRTDNTADQAKTSIRAKGKEPERAPIPAPRPPSPVEPQEKPNKIPQLRNFAPRRREFGENTLFQPQTGPAKAAAPPATTNVLKPDNSQVGRFFEESRQLIEPQKKRRQRVRAQNGQQISAEVFSSPKTTPPRHEPNRAASPAKSSFRSPLKGRTPGPVVEFTSSTLSPLPRERRANSSQKTRQSRSQKQGAGEGGIGERTGADNRREEPVVSYPELPEPQPEASEEEENGRQADPFSDTSQQRKDRELREQQDRQGWRAQELGPPLHYGKASFEQRLHQAKAQEPEQRPRGATWEGYGREVEEQPSELDWEAIGEQEPDQGHYDEDGEDRDQEPTPPLSEQDQQRYEPYQPRQRDYQGRDLEPVEEEGYSDEEEEGDYDHHQQGTYAQEGDYDHEDDYDHGDYNQEDDHDHHQQGEHGHEQEQEEEEPPQSFFPKFSLPSLPNPLSLLSSLVPTTTSPPPNDPLKGWGIPNWELLDQCLTLHRQHRLPILPLSDVSKSYVGLVPSIGEPQEAMTIEVWHLQIVEYYKHVVLHTRGEEDKWTEWELVRMLFAVLIGEMRRRDRKGMEERRRKREEVKKERERKKRGWFSLGGVFAGGGKKYKVEKPKRKERSRR